MSRPGPVAAVVLLALVAAVPGHSRRLVSGGNAGAQGADAGFSLSADFRDVPSLVRQHGHGNYEPDPFMYEAYGPIRRAFEETSTPDKVSVVAFEDKLMLHSMVDWLAHSMAEGNACPDVERIKQMPIYAWVQDKQHVSAQYHSQTIGPRHFTTDRGNFLGSYPKGKGGDNWEHVPQKLIAKATHLANAEGAKWYDRAHNSTSGEKMIEDVFAHCREHLHYHQTSNYEFGKAVALSTRGPNHAVHVSEAAAHVVPGCVLQAEYPALHVDESNTTANEMWKSWHGGTFRPLELRAQIVWGSVHMVGLFDSGRLFLGFERVENAEGKTNWSAVVASDWPEAAVASATGHLRQFLDVVAGQAECLAGALGVPWARIDFFVPPPGSQWPVVFNELEVLSGLSWTEPHREFEIDDESEFEIGIINAHNDKLFRAWDAGEKAWIGAGSPVTSQAEILERFGCAGGASGYRDLKCRGHDLGTEGASTQWFAAAAAP